MSASVDAAARLRPAFGAGGRPSQRRCTSIGIAAVIHVVLVWILLVDVRPSTLPAAPQDLQVTVFKLAPLQHKPPAPPLDWLFEAPPDVFVPEPEIQLPHGAPAPGGITAKAVREMLAPRADPSHVNERPQLPGTMGGVVATLSLELRILVMPDGSVFSAQVLRSCGQPEIDRLAVNWVKNSWRYLPASVDGEPIQAWTTVRVRFAAIH